MSFTQIYQNPFRLDLNILKQLICQTRNCFILPSSLCMNPFAPVDSCRLFVSTTHCLDSVFLHASRQKAFFNARSPFLNQPRRCQKNSPASKCQLQSALATVRAPQTCAAHTSILMCLSIVRKRSFERTIHSSQSHRRDVHSSIVTSFRPEKISLHCGEALPCR